MRKKAKRTSARSGRLVLFLAVLLIVVLLFMSSDTLRGATIQRLIYLIGSGVSGTADTADISFQANDQNQFHLLNSGLAVLSNESLTIYAMSGEQKSTTRLTYRTPTISGSEKYLIAYDRGGTDLLVTNGSSALLQTEAAASIINANINKNGAFSLITDGPDCKTLLSIYNPSMDVVYKLYSTEQYLLDAAVSNNNKDMAVLALSASDGGFVGKVEFYHLDEETPYFTHSIADCVPLAVEYDNDNRIRVLCENRILLFEKDGTVRNEISFTQNELLSYSFDSPRMIALLSDNYSTGGHSGLTVLPRNESEPLRISFSEETLSVSAAGNYLAVRCPSKIVVYDRKLQLDRTYIIPAGVKNCIMREDGTVLAIGADFASLLIS